MCITKNYSNQIKVIWKYFARTSSQTKAFDVKHFLMILAGFSSKSLKIMQKSLPPHVWVIKNRLVRFPITPRTLLDSFGLVLHRENLFDHNLMRRTHYFHHFLKTWFFKNLKNLQFWLENPWKWLSGSLKVLKSPSPHVCGRRNRFTRRTTTPFDSADTHGPKQVLKNKFWILNYF